jgi:hypothetical protein
MHAALGFLLILTVHRCYPAGVPRCLQRNLIRRQIRNYSQTLCLIWAFAVLINLPLFPLTKYDNNSLVVIDNITNTSQITSAPTCDTEANEIWSRTYLILLLVLTYVITGIFLIVIYGQVIRIILTSKKYANKNNKKERNNGERYHFLTRHIINQEKFHETSTSSSSANSLNRHPPRVSSSTLPISLMVPVEKNNVSTSSHSAQHLQVIIMLFVVILLYILLLLPYRLLNLLFIVYNQLFQQNLMNEILFYWLLNTVRLLVFLNCALQPITYLIISSRLRQTVIKFLQASCYKCYCQCQCSLSLKTEQQDQNDNRTIKSYLPQQLETKTHHSNRQKKFVVCNTNASVNNINLIGYQPLPLSRSKLVITHFPNKTPYTVTFANSLRK